MSSYCFVGMLLYFFSKAFIMKYRSLFFTVIVWLMVVNLYFTWGRTLAITCFKLVVSGIFVYMMKGTKTINILFPKLLFFKKHLLLFYSKIQNKLPQNYSLVILTHFNYVMFIVCCLKDSLRSGMSHFKRLFWNSNYTKAQCTPKTRDFNI